MVSVGILHGDFSDEAIILYRRLRYRDPVAGLRFSEADGVRIYSVYTIMGEGVLACEGHVVSVLYQGRLAGVFLYISSSNPEVRINWFSNGMQRGASSYQLNQLAVICSSCLSSRVFKAQ
jgi:hypothetical protein